MNNDPYTEINSLNEENSSLKQDIEKLKKVVELFIQTVEWMQIEHNTSMGDDAINDAKKLL